MSNALLPGYASTIRNSHASTPLVVALVVVLGGAGYFAFRSAERTDAPTAPPAAVPVNVVTQALPQTPSASVTHEHADLALHIEHVRTNLRAAITQVARTRRLTELESSSLEAKGLWAESRRVNAAATSAAVALDVLARSLEELEVSSRLVTKEN